METATLTLICPDKKGLIAGVTNFIFTNSGNIITLDEFVDPITNLFFMRVKWDLEDFTIPKEVLAPAITKLTKQLGIEDNWELHFSGIKRRMAIFVSKYDHCLFDLLLRHRSGEMKCDIPLVISNHDDLKGVADIFDVDFHVVKKHGNKASGEKEELELLKRYDIDFIVLARYMQILSEEFINNFENKIINIHHSFLPAFEGSKAYHQAYERGVKIIGATSHFVTTELDKGPIIRQDVVPVTHKDKVEDLGIKGRDLERKVLADAVKLFIAHRVFVCGKRTIIL